jgi:hypothetical protein
MLLRELIAPTVPTTAPVVEPEPSPQEIDSVQQLIGTIDPQRETAQSMLNTITGWMRSHPLLDRVTDLIPQTRLVKAIGAAVDAIEAKDTKKAIQALATVIGGSTAQAVNTVNRTVNTAQALQQGDPLAAAQAYGGTIGKVARVQQTLAPRL